MTSHTSKRTAASRHQASSPAKQSTQSPVAKRTRTRSASLELEHYDASIAKRGKRTVRQGSLESVDSNVSTASSSRGGRRKRAPRGKNANPGKHRLDQHLSSSGDLLLSKIYRSSPRLQRLTKKAILMKKNLQTTKDLIRFINLLVACHKCPVPLL